MGYIDEGKKGGAKVHLGGARHGNEGFFIQPTIFTECNLDMKITQEEIFGPVATIIKFKTEEEVIEMANNTSYGLACHVFTQNISRGIRVAHALETGSAWVSRRLVDLFVILFMRPELQVNNAQVPEVGVPFGGYKQSGIGRELGEYALDTYVPLYHPGLRRVTLINLCRYTQVKAVHINIGPN